MTKQTNCLQELSQESFQPKLIDGKAIFTNAHEFHKKIVLQVNN